MPALLQKFQENYSQESFNTLLKAYNFAKDAHEGQKRASGEPYFIHPCAVAEILLDLGLDSATVTAALLHDIIEDTPVTPEGLQKEFGEEVATLVSGVTKLDKIVFKSHEEEEAENFRKIFLAMAKDILVIIIKLADRLHNMRSLNFLSEERQKRMARETLEIFCPIAGRLGISQINCELEDLSLKYLDPNAYEYLIENINQQRNEREEFVSFVVQEIKNLLQESGIQGEISGRPKHFYSIYKKMKNKNKKLDEIYDLTAVRVIVNNITECYEILGKIHEKWKPIPRRIKDYIATPKPNMYQSLHTTVVTNFGQPFEIQIRTVEMHRTAEYGIAAHWKYKEGATDPSIKKVDQLNWIREAMDWQGGVKDSKEFMDALKTELYSSELLVFTPKGKVISLPIGATPVDFAYAIHSQVGNRCTGAKVNGKIVALNTQLETGDVIEIITSPNAKGPSWDWLKFIKSSSAKVKIKQYFKNAMKEENISRGKDKLEEEASRRGYRLNELLNEASFKAIAAKFSFNSTDEMFASVGYGAVGVNQVIFRLVDFYNKAVPKTFTPTAGNNRRNTGGISIKGVSGLLIRLAGCCSPIPGDDIVGFVSRGRGVVVHRNSCPNIRGVERERLQVAEWLDAGEGTKYNAHIEVRAADQGVILSVVSTVVSDMRLAITSVNGRLDKNNSAVVELGISLSKKEDVETLIKKVKSDARIFDVYRTTGV
ncbi:MAG: bifunctional (p)ppGpp synthetase/guanosine-3',5'-bis(diphosphate) 3'-pyrophosphohydrolase [Clostridia bacterium]|nr:bifunctional (p)ppGpp synthetase/guanosine-3',5'-bis(diphosphate) 3'-pyrophosphohydrolase [Clostridia bacterium]